MNTNKKYKKVLKLKKKNLCKAILLLILFIAGSILLYNTLEWMKENDEEMINACMKNEVNNRDYCYRQIKG